MTELPILDNVIYQEMMAHPALFMHPNPQQVAIIGDENCGILQEALQHPEVASVDHILDTQARLIHHDDRVTLQTGSVADWIKNTLPESLDILIIASDAAPDFFTSFYNLLKSDGIVVQQAGSPFQLNKLKAMQSQVQEYGFQDLRFLIYSQPNFPAGLRTTLLAKKRGIFQRIREKDIFDKIFPTRYYNFDVHQAALVLPEFMRSALEPVL